jgi:hypothetical protein
MSAIPIRRRSFQDALKTVVGRAGPGDTRTITDADRPGLQRLGRVPVCRYELHGRPPIAAPSRFLVVTEDGNLQCWAETGSRQAERMRSFTLAVNGEAGSVYKGLAITPFRSGNRLYGANFGLRRIDVFDGAYQPRPTACSVACTSWIQ